MSKVFNSLTDPIPPMRYDVQRIPVQQNGQSYLYFHDQMGYTESNFALPIESEELLSLINGHHSVRDILKFGSDKISEDDVLNYVQFLDRNRLLQSSFFEFEANRIEEEYEADRIHRSVTAGNSYPSEKEKLNAYLNEAFQEHENFEPVPTAKALYAPHIDTRIGIESYVKAFSAIKNIKPKKVFILATSHYSGLYPDIYKDSPFIISRKEFHLPNGIVKPDLDIIDTLMKAHSMNKMETGISFMDRAHRIEHSIELHLLFLNHIWNHLYKIIPILVGGIDEILYSVDSFRQKQIHLFSSLLEELSSDESFFLISGDLSHIGKKFGDISPANQLFDEIDTNDRLFLEAGQDFTPSSMLDLMRSNYDKYRICGFPPLYTFLNTFYSLKGETLSYDVWDESERESAVSYGSILFR